MSKRAEELAAQYKATCDRGGKCERRGRCATFCEDAKADFEQYGQEVREAAAKLVHEGADSVDIREMPLP